MKIEFKIYDKKTHMEIDNMGQIMSDTDLLHNRFGGFGLDEEGTVLVFDRCGNHAMLPDKYYANVNIKIHEDL